MSNPVYTIGHSNREWKDFLDLLREHDITAVCDVRSHPYSRFNPQFDRETVRDSLKAGGIAYIYLGKELGGRPEDGEVRYERVIRSNDFRRGIERLLKGRETHCLALMCAEKDPLGDEKKPLEVCHRIRLISRQLDESGIQVRHILGKNKCETEGQTLERWCEKLDISPDLIHSTKKEMFHEARSAWEHEIARKTKPKTARHAGIRNKPVYGNAQ